MPFQFNAKSWTFTLHAQTPRHELRITYGRSASPNAGRNRSAPATQRAGCARETSMPQWCVRALWAVLIVVLVGWPTVAT